jgi:ketosteroid isomerase-like protein
MSNEQTISAIYEAFLRGDIPFILNQLADGVEWNYATDNEAQKAGVPWLTLRRGTDGVVEFFKAVEEMGIYQFDVLSLTESETEVAARLVIGCKYFVDEIIHFWTFNDEGKIVRYQQFVDTAKQIAGIENFKKSAAA